MEHAGSGKWVFIPFAEKFLPGFAEYYFRGKTFLLKEINLFGIVEIFQSAVAHYLMSIKNKTEDENAFLQVMIGQFLHPEAALLKLDSIFQTKDEKTNKNKPLRMNKYTLHALANRLEERKKA
ncbi:MAG: hypothetical protein ABIH20_01770 [Candidatus Diapherotrites archaeon]